MESGNTNKWGSLTQPFWRPGANYTVDLVVLRKNKILLIKRGNDPFKGSWALPGGFHDTESLKGEPWTPGLETALEAAQRELLEETGIDLEIVSHEIEEIGCFNQFGRDPRDNPEAWAETTGFLVVLKEDVEPVASDDAVDTNWVLLDEIDRVFIAFDHVDIIKKALSSKRLKK